MSSHVVDTGKFVIPEWGESRVVRDENGITVELKIGTLDDGGSLAELDGRGDDWHAQVTLSGGKVTWRLDHPEVDELFTPADGYMDRMAAQVLHLTLDAALHNVRSITEIPEPKAEEVKP